MPRRYLPCTKTERLWTGWYVRHLRVRRQHKSPLGSGRQETSNRGLSARSRWKGKIVMPSPITTGGGYIFLATQVFRFGMDETRRWLS